jgi:hypothetical protein
MAAVEVDTSLSEINDEAIAAKSSKWFAASLNASSEPAPLHPFPTWIIA